MKRTRYLIIGILEINPLVTQLNFILYFQSQFLSVLLSSFFNQQIKSYIRIKEEISIFVLNHYKMNIQAEKIELIKMLLNTDNPRIIQSIKQIFIKEKNTDFWDELTPDQQKEIHQASAEIEQGKTTDYEAFMSKHR